MSLKPARLGPTFQIPEGDLVEPGHTACPGCGAAIAMKLALRALGAKTAIVMPACCWSVIAGRSPDAYVGVPLFHTAFASAAAVASGVRAGLDVRGDRETVVLAWAGDGGTFDIGIQSLSGAAERNEDLIFACYDNEAYMNTGIQKSSATPLWAWTNTTPLGKGQPKKDILGVMAAHRIPYAATASIAYPEDFVAKFKKAREIRGTRFLHLFSPCPTGWRAEEEDTIRLARLAVETRAFALVEVVDGIRTRITYRPRERRPIDEYLKLQGRFRSLTPDQTAEVQAAIDEGWERLVARSE